MRQLALYGMTVEKAFTPQLSLKETFTMFLVFNFQKCARVCYYFICTSYLWTLTRGGGGGWDDYCSCCLQQHKEDVN